MVLTTSFAQRSTHLSADGFVLEIRRLNDLLRCHLIGGRLMITRGIQALDTLSVVKILMAVAAFDAFNRNNDPHGEHDRATLEVDGIPVLWKIDYYDETLSFGSENPADPSITTRVLTIMLPEEY